MVAIITGKGTGLERSSAFVLGSRGQLGTAALGRNGEGVFVNAASGNLVITRQDEFLIGLGPDISINRTYNSLATVSDGDNDDKWRMGVYRKIVGAGTAASVTRIDWDGSETVYAGGPGNYSSKEGSGPSDTLTWSAGTSQWTWTDGGTQSREIYDSAGKLISAIDTDGNTVSYTYNGSQISRVTSNNAPGDGDDDYTDFTYNGTLLTQLVTSKSSGWLGTLTRVRYGYDGANRLSTVTVDLSPHDGTVADAKTYVTSYTYDPADATNKRVASIAQQDGSYVAFTYVLVGSDYKVASYTQTVAAGVTRTTRFDYSVAGRTTVTDPAGQKTILWYGANNELTQISYPPESSDATPKVVQFTYNGNGDVASTSFGPGNVITSSYDANGNLLNERDSAGNTVARTYGAKNELLTETRYLVADPDGAGANPPTTPVTTRYAYDGENHLRYVVSGEGFVTQYEYNAAGQRTAANDYAGNAYPIAGLAENASIAEGTLTSWVTGLDKTSARRTETTYDYRGAVWTVKSYSKMLSNGLFDTSSELSQTTYFYDQAGKLLSRTISGSSANEVFVYDGLNRLTQTTDFNNAVTRTYFLDSLGQTVLTHANGLSETSTYNRAGELIAFSTSSAGGNLVDTTGWPANSDVVPSGQATLPGWMNPVGFTDETRWASTLGPDGVPVVAMQAGQLDTSEEGGGNYTHEITIDATKAYEFSWQFKLSAMDKHYVFFGLSGAAPAYVENLSDGADNNNPYFWYAYPGMQDAYLDPDKWYKVVGYVLPQGTAASSAPLGGVFDMATGQKVLDIHLNFRWNPERPGNTVHSRFFDYYGTDYQNYSTYFLAPEVRQVSAPTVTTPDMATSRYLYDSLGRLRMTIDPSGGRNYMLYDSVGRKVADVDSDGSVIEYRYDGSDNLTSTTRYVNKLSAAQLLQLADFDSGNGAPVTNLTSGTLLTNGSFDTSAGSYTTLAHGRSSTTLPNWTKANAEDFEQVTAGQFGVTGTDGGFWLDLDSVPASGIVPTGPNLVSNGSFDTSGTFTTISTGRSNTTLPNWAKTNAENFEQVTSGQMGVTATDGAFWLDLDSVAGGGVIPLGSNLLTNGSFDTSGAYTATATGRSNTDLPGWIKANTETFEQVASGQMGVNGTDGAYWLDMDSVAGTGYVPTGSNLLTNGSFDTSGAFTTISTGRSNTTLPGWTKANAETFEQVTSGQMGVTGSDGAYWLDLDSVASTGAYVPIGPNLVLNPSFETSAAGFTNQSWGRSSSTLPNWTKTNAEDFEQVLSGFYGVTATNGSYWLDLDSVQTGYAAVGSNLLTNGSFETSGSGYTTISTGRTANNMPGWTNANSFLFEQVTSGQMGVTATNGSFWLDMDSVAGGNPNLIVNGSFEQSAASYTTTGTGRLNDASMNIPGWVKTNALGYEQVNSGVNGTNATDGAFYLDMDSTGAAGSNMDISQTVTGLTAGQAYTLKFDYANNAGFVGDEWDSSGSLDVLWNGNVIATIGVQDIAMATKTYTVTATGTTGVLRFRETGIRDGIGALIDNVRLTSNGSTNGGNMDISQTISGLPSGSIMQIQFDHANRTTSGSGSFQLLWNGGVWLTINSTGTTMQTKTIYVITQGTTNTLRFRGTGTVDANGASLDNVRLFATEPTGGGNMDISQTIPSLTAGQIMQLQFDHANRTTAASGSFEVYWNNALVATITDTGTTMQTKTYQVAAIAGNNALRFKSIGTVDTAGASIDNVRLFATQVDPGGGNMDISQTVSGLTAGQVMQLQFDHANRTTGASGSFEVYWNGNLVATINSTGTTMVSKSYQFTAIAGTNTLRFKGTGTVDANGASIDNVRLFATTTPVGGGNMDISQTVSGLSAGQTMLLQFDHANRTTAASGSFEVYWNNALVATIADTGTAMQTKTYQVTALAGNNTVRFKALGTVDANGASIDNVRLFATQVDVGGGNMDINQTIGGLAAGQVMQLQFDHANRTTSGSGSFEVYWNNALVATITSTGTTMQTKTYQVSAIAGNNTLRFKGTGTVDANGASIDNVRLFATTTPVGGGNMDISQSVGGLTAGQIMQLQFNHANRTSAASGSFEVYWNNALVATISDTGTAMQTKTFLVAAAAGTNTLRFKGTGTVDAVGASIDNVRLYTTSTTVAPGSLGTKLAGLRPAAHADDRWTFQIYDAAQRLVQTIDGTGATSVFTYDGASRLTGTTQHANRIAAATLTSLKAAASNPNYWLNPQNGTLWPSSNLTIAAAGTIDGSNAYQFTVAASNTWQAFRSDEIVVAAGTTVTATISIKAVGAVTTDSFGIYGSATGWGANSAEASAAVVSGPGTLTQAQVGYFQIANLSTTEATRITITRTFTQADTVASYFYVNNGSTNAVAGHATIAAAPILAATPSKPVYLPAADAANDRVSRSFYDADGRLVGKLDGEGYLTQIVYDKGGRKTKTIAYWGATSAGLRATGTFAQLLASVVIDNSKDIHNYFVYDARGMLRATVDGEGDLTRYRYTALGDVDQVITGQKLDPAALLATPPTFVNLPAAPGGAILQTVSYTRNLYGQVLTETRSLTGGATTLTTYTYDNRRRLVSTVTQSGGIDPRTQSQRYDLRGRLTGELSGIGSAALAALGGSPTQAQIDQVYADYGTTHVYDQADRVISSTDPNGARTLFYYDPDGRLAYQVDARGEAVEYRYNSLGDRTDVIVYAARIAPATLAGLKGGPVTAAIVSAIVANSALDSVTHSDFNLDGTVKQSIDPLASLTTYAYNAFGELSGRFDPLEGAATIETSRIYDRRGLLKMETVDPATKAISTSYGYDAFGRPVLLTNAENKQVVSAYDRAGRLASTTDALNHVTGFSYDARSNLVAVTDAANKVTRYVYDKANRRIASIDATGAVVATKYDADGRAIETRSYYHTISIAGLPLEVTETALTLPGASGNDRITRMAYDKDGRLRFIVDGLNHLVEYVYDDVGKAVRSIEYAGTIGAPGDGIYSAAWLATQAAALAGLAGTRYSRSVYDSVGRLAYAIDAIGQVTASTYDSKGLLIKQVELAALYTGTTDPSAATMDTWLAGNANASLDRTNRAIYDRKGQLAYSVNALGYITEYQYDKLGNVRKQIAYADPYAVTDSSTKADVAALLGGSPPASARISQFEYDSAGRLETTTDPEGFKTRLVLDKLGQVLTATTGFNTTQASVTTRTYNDVGQLWTETRGYGTAEATTTTYGYDALGRMTSRIAASNLAGDSATTNWEYDVVGRMTKEIRGVGTADQAQHRFDYDALGRAMTETDARNGVTTRTFDALDHVIGEKVQVDAIPAHDLETLNTYDEFGNLVKVRDPRLNEGFFYYDKLNRLTLQVDPEGYATKTVFSRGGLAESMTRYWNRTSGTPTIAAAPTIVTDALRDAVTQFEYDRLDRLTKTIDAQGKDEAYVLNAFGDRTKVRNKLGSGLAPTDPAFDSFATIYTHDKRGLVLTELLQVGSTNSSGVLVAATITNKYEYDARGNRTKMIEAFGLAEARTTNYFHDKLDRLYQTVGDSVPTVGQDLVTISYAAPTETLTYDKRGNVIKVDANGALTFCYYDDLDRKVGEVGPTGTLSWWSYDGNGNITSAKIFGDPIASPPLGGTRPDPLVAANCRETVFVYDLANRVLTSTVSGLATGSFDGTSFVQSGTPITSQNVYDAAGNIVREIDGRLNSSFTYFDKLGRRVATVDRENYLTVWTLDAEGNALSETRYAKRVVGGFSETTSVATLQAQAGTDAADRTTTFEYDRNGRRTKETRQGVVAWTVSSTGALVAEAPAALIQYSYDGLGNVTRKIEANGEITDFEYDRIGRHLRTKSAQFVDHNGVSVVPLAESFYNGLNDVVRTEMNRDGGPAAEDRVELYAYGTGGRLTAMTDAGGFTRNFEYDLAGRVAKESYSRLKSDGTTSIAEAIGYRYDAAGQLKTQFTATWNGAAYVAGEANRINYNAYGEVIGRGTTATPADAAVYQETFDYDAGGRLWRSTAGDGVLRFYMYDKAGNQALTLASTGADLSSLTLANYAGSITAAGGTSTAGAVTTVAVYDKRGLQTMQLEPDRQLSHNGSAFVTQAIAINRTFNAFGELLSESDARNANWLTEYSYNNMGRLTQKISPSVAWTAENGALGNARPTETQFYDISGRLVGLRDANNNYLTRHLLAGTGHGGEEALTIAEFHADGGVARTFYDAFREARLVRNELLNSASTAYNAASDEQRSYDKMGRLTQVTQRGGLLVDSYGYDGLGRRTRHWNSLLGPGNVERTDYDALGRVTGAVAFGGDTTTTDYAWETAISTAGLGDFDGWKKTTTLANGLFSIENADYFGRLTSKTDFGLHGTSYAYDKAGRLTSQAVTGETLSFAFFNTGLAWSATNNAGNMALSGYDAAGNKTSEWTQKAYAVVQNATASYDALGRMTNWAEAGNATAPAATLAYEYDLASNIRRSLSTYRRLDLNGNPGALSGRDNWYRYDTMDRVVTEDGFLTGVDGQGQTVYGDQARGFGTIKRQVPGPLPSLNVERPTGADYVYDAAGRRQSMAITTVRFEGGSFAPTAYFREQKEMYDYAVDGHLSGTRFATGAETIGTTSTPPPASGPGVLQSTFERDAMGRVTRQTDWNTVNTTKAYERYEIVYNAKGQVTDEKVATRRTNDLYTSVIHNEFGAGGGYMLGAATQSVSTNKKNDILEATATTTNNYAWWDSAIQSTTTIATDYVSIADTNYTTTYTLGASGELVSAYIADGRPRNVTLVTDMNGQILRRDEADGNFHATSGGDPHEVWYRFAGRQVGQTGNNGTLDTDYSTSIGARGLSTGNGAFRFGVSTPTVQTDFSQALDPINSFAQGSAGGGYTVRAGETLQSIAANLWGDSSLWYKLAQANGLSGASGLLEGQSLVIPMGVMSNGHSADIFQPYEAGKALGDLSPTAIKAPKRPNNRCGMMGAILLIAIAVAVTVVTAGAAVAALAPTAMSLGAGIGAFVAGSAGFGTMVVAGAVGGALGSIVSQGVGVVTGLQEKFSWKSVGMAAISGAISAGLGKFSALSTVAKGEKFARIGGTLGKIGQFLGRGNVVSGAVRGVLSSVLTQGVGVATGLQKKFDWLGVATAGIGGGVSTGIGAKLGGWNKYAAQLVSGGAGAIANAATRTIVNGSSFGDNLMAALPDVIGSTIGNLIGDSLASRAPDYDGDGIVSASEDSDSYVQMKIQAARDGAQVQKAQVQWDPAADERAEGGAVGGGDMPGEQLTPSGNSIETPGFPSMPTDPTETSRSQMFWLMERLNKAENRPEELARIARYLAANQILAPFIAREGYTPPEFSANGLRDAIAAYAIDLMNFRGDANLNHLDSTFVEYNYTHTVLPMLRELGTDPSFGPLFRVVGDLTQEMYAEYLVSPAYQAGENRAAYADRLGMAGIAIMTLPLAIEGLAAGATGNVLARAATYAGMIAEVDFIVTSLSAPVTENDQSLLARGIDSLIPGEHGNSVVLALSLASPARALASLSRTAMSRIRAIGPSFMRRTTPLPTSGLNVTWRPGMEARNIVDSHGNNVTVFGQSARGSSTTAGHGEAMDELVERLAATGEYEYFTLQRSWRTATGREAASRSIPDVIGVRRNGTVDAWEVASTTDVTSVLMARLRTGMASVPASRRGIVDVIPPRPPGR